MQLNEGPRSGLGTDKGASNKPSEASGTVHLMNDKRPDSGSGAVPSTSGTTARPASRSAQPPTAAGRHAGDERYAVLLRRIDDLERAHADSKRNHQVALDRYKSELVRATKTGAEQSEKLDRLKKQHDAHALRVEDLKDAGAAGQAEIKALRARLRACEHERDQLAKREGEAGDANKALLCAEAVLKEEVRERDRKVAELEKTVAAERKKREMLASALDDVRKKADGEAARLHADSASLLRKLETAQKDGKEARQAACAARDQAEDREEEVLSQLEQCKVALGRVAEEYARLASSTVPASAHDVLKEEYAVLRYRSLRFERKLANSEGQVTELAHLIRQTKEENKLLLERLRDAEEEIAFYSRLLRESNRDRFNVDDGDIPGLERELGALHLDIAQGHAPVALVEYHAAAHDFYRDLVSDMELRAGSLENAIEREQSANRVLAEEVASHIALRDASNIELQALQTGIAEANCELANERISLAEVRRSREMLQDKVNVMEKQLSEQASQHKAALQKERDVAQKLTMQLRMSKTAEETLKGEVEQLTLELTEGARFQDAYYRLLNETEGLLARNDLAEEEAARLSRFNAEILGHHNPAQRIVYVDRVRRELADAKQKLLVCTRERDTLAASNEDLRHEIEMYKSSVVPIESRPRSQFIRVSRPPLANQSLNGRSASPTRHMVEHTPGPANMTLDELI